MAKMIIIEADAAGQRIDNFIFKHLKGVPKVRVYKAIRKGEVRVNLKRIKPEYRLKVDDKVRIPPLEPSSTNAATVKMPRNEVSNALINRIVYEDKSLLVMDKPAGLAVHGGSGIQGGLIEILRLIRPDLHFLELVHRLDRETSGCLLLAKKRQALISWHQRLTQRCARKHYLALVRGVWRGEERKVDQALIKNVLSSGERIVKVHSEGKSAVTWFNPVKRFDNMTLVEAFPLTGRTHQIRVHLAHIGHPIAADDKYGDREFNLEVRRLGLKRLFLHALSMSFPGEADGEGMFGLCIPLESELQEFLKKLT